MTVLPFLVLGAIAVVFALMLILLRNAVHGALCLVVTFGVMALFFLLLGAEFIAVVQVGVYAGAIMVLFLFVMMLLNIQGNEKAVTRKFSAQVITAVILGLALLGEVLYVTPRTMAMAAQSPAVVQAGFGSPRNIGTALFANYLLPFEITSFILLAAMVGAVVLVNRRPT